MAAAAQHHAEIAERDQPLRAAHRRDAIDDGQVAGPMPPQVHRHAVEADQAIRAEEDDLVQLTAGRRGGQRAAAPVEQRHAVPAGGQTPTRPVGRQAREWTRPPGDPDAADPTEKKISLVRHGSHPLDRGHHRVDACPGQEHGPAGGRVVDQVARLQPVTPALPVRGEHAVAGVDDRDVVGPQVVPVPQRAVHRGPHAEVHLRRAVDPLTTGGDRELPPVRRERATRAATLHLEPDRPRLRRERPRIAAVAAAGEVRFLLLTPPEDHGPQHAGREQARSKVGIVRIASVNTWGGALYDRLVTWLPDSKADVICLQEVTRTPGLSGWTRFEDEHRSLPQRADLFGDVRAALPRHQAIFVTSDSGPVHDDAGARHRQDFGLATLVAEHLPVVGADSAFVHGQFTDHAEWPGTDRPRIALAVHTVDRETDRPVWVVQLHGLRDAAGKSDSPARRRQAERLVELLRRIRGPRDVVVVCGDLNLLPSSETFGMLSEIGFTDLVGEADTRTSHYRKPVRHASYLLVSDVAAVQRFEIMAEPEVSDHRALILDL